MISYNNIAKTIGFKEWIFAFMYSENTSQKIEIYQNIALSKKEDDIIDVIKSFE